jgi:hypothetical protein
MMGQNKHKKRQQNQGTAMIVAIVVGLVVMVFTLSLLLVSYSLFSSAVRQSTQTKCRELAKSLNNELRQELLTPDYSSFADMKDKAGSENNLWFYIRCNLWQGDMWPYYKDGESGHGVDDSYRYFTLDTSDFDGMADKILVTVYWEIDSDNPKSETDKNLTLLHVITEVEKNEEVYSVETKYELNISAFITENGYGEMETIDNSDINPDNNTIDNNERWTWVLE